MLAVYEAGVTAEGRAQTGKVRAAVNRWVLTGGAFDAVVDFDKATRDAANPRRLLSGFDSGGHLHLSDAGYKAMADAIDLTIFTRRK